MRLSRLVLLALLLASLLQVAYYHPRVPERMASHFDGAGDPNGYQSRDGFFGLSAAIALLTAGLFGGMGPFLRRLPSEWFNLPHREYWLSTELREETLDFLSRQFEWYGAATLLLLLAVFQMVLSTNLGPEPRLDASTVWMVLGLYLAFNAVWLVRFIGRFRKLPPDAPSIPGASSGRSTVS